MARMAEEQKYERVRPVEVEVQYPEENKEALMERAVVDVEVQHPEGHREALMEQAVAEVEVHHPEGHKEKLMERAVAMAAAEMVVCGDPQFEGGMQLQLHPSLDLPQLERMALQG